MLYENILFSSPGETRTHTPYAGHEGLNLACLPFHHWTIINFKSFYQRTNLSTVQRYEKIFKQSSKNTNIFVRMYSIEYLCLGETSGFEPEIPVSFQATHESGLTPQIFFQTTVKISFIDNSSMRSFIV